MGEDRPRERPSEGGGAVTHSLVRTIRLALTAAAVLAAAFLFLLLPLPEGPRALDTIDSAPLTVAGAIHIHTIRSDGSGTVDQVAEAAARAGLGFIVLTDHGDGTRNPDPPRYSSGVLVIDGVELSTDGGHYLAIGLPQSPYPLRGEARDVIEDVKRLGGFGIVAHPDSSKPELRWRDWDAPFDGIEWLNADTEWRDEGALHLTRALMRYPFRPAATLASLLDRPSETLERWDSLSRSRRVIAVAGADAHARLGWQDDEAAGYRRGRFVRIPSYEASFRTFANRILLDSPLQRDASADAVRVLTALRAGRLYTAIDALASPPMFEFTTKDSGLHVRTNAPAGSSIVIRQDGRIAAEGSTPQLTLPLNAPSGTYRAEVYAASAPGAPAVPWIISNPIYLHPPGWGEPQSRVESPAAISQNIQGGPWHVEKDDRSAGSFAQPDYPRGPVQFTFQLGGTDRSDQYTALGISVGTALTDRTRIAFRAQASRPVRLSVQARQPKSGKRWQRSIYLDQHPRDVVVRFDEVRAVGKSGPFNPAVVDTVLFVIDTVNTTPGTNGEVTIGNMRVER